MFSGTFFSDAKWDRALEGRPSRNLSFGGTFLLKTALLNGFSYFPCMMPWWFGQKLSVLAFLLSGA